MLDNGGLMPLADRGAGAHRRRQAQRHRRAVRGGQGGHRRLRDLRTARQGRGAWRWRRNSCSCTTTTCRAGKGRANSAPLPARLEAGIRRRRHDGRRHRSRDPRRLADRAAAADHRPGEDAARRAAGRGTDAGRPAGGARTLAGDGRAGKARRLADGDRQAPGARSSAPPPDARAQARDGRCATWSRSSRRCPIWTPRWTTISATNCCG